MSPPPPPQDILWKKSKTKNSHQYMDLFKIKHHEIPLTPIEHEVKCGRFSSLLTQKNNQEAQFFREAGKKWFAQGKYALAMKEFNNCLRLAENETEEVGLAYANRSSCFFHMNMLEECMIDLKLAKRSRYPADLMTKLETRMSECTALTKDKTFKSNRFNIREPTLSFGEHEKFAGVADCLEIRRDEGYGCDVIATHELEIGQTILVEKPYSIVSTTKYKHLGRDRCTYCFREFRNFIACTNCTGSRYCYEGCMEESFHNLSCNLPTNHRKTPSDQYNLVQEILLKTNDAFPDVDMLMQTMDLLLQREEPTRLTNAIQRDFCLFFQLTHNHDKRSQKDIQKLRMVAASIFSTFMELPEFNLKFTKMKHARFLQHLILHLLHIAVHAIDLYQYFHEEDSTSMVSCTSQQYASAIYPFGCNINHSCVPNICCFTIDDRLICKVIRPIKRGEQIYRSYSGQSSLVQDPHLIAELDKRYQFKCECFICSNQIWSHLTGGINCTQDSLYQEAIESIFLTSEEFRKLPRERMEHFEGKAVDFLNKYDTIHPVNDTITIQKTLTIVWILLASRFEFAHASTEN